MLPVSDTFKQVLSQEGSTIGVLVEILDINGEVIRDDLPVTSGYVTVDIDSANRRTARITVSPHPDAIVEWDGTSYELVGYEYELVPQTLMDLIAPGRHEFRVWRGIALLSGDTLQDTELDISTDSEWDEGEHDMTESTSGSLRMVF